ncbi:MAG: hypothetical protein JW866_00960 [Ignavibacteriales bacterium]|nr:hypothetical protein [Ignavibacteriales bacterium]
MLKKLIIPSIIFLIVFSGCGAKSDKEKALELASKVVEFLKSDEGKDMFTSFEKAELFDDKVTEIALDIGFETREEADSIMISLEEDEDVQKVLIEYNNILRSYFEQLYQ